MESVGKMENKSVCTFKTEKTSPWTRIIKTVFLVLAWVCLGLADEIQGTAFKDLEIKININTEELSRALSGRNIGFFVAAATGGFIVDKFTRYLDLMIALYIDLIAVTAVIIPWSPNGGVLWAMIFFQGMCEGMINIAGQRIILQLWRARASSPLQILHFGYGIGSFIAPNIANPFLAITRDQDIPTNVTFNETVFTGRSTLSSNPITTPIPQTTDTVSRFVKESEVHIAYIIIAVIIVTISLPFYWYQIFSKHSPLLDPEVKDKEKTCKSVVRLVDPATCTKGDRAFGIQLFVLLFLYYFTQMGGETLCSKFIRNYSIDRFKFSRDEGSLINTSFWISFSVGRFISFLAAIWIPIRVLIIIEVCGAALSAAMLNIFAYDNKLLFWIFTQPMGLFVAPLYPAGIAWCDSYVEVTGVAITCLILGASLGGVAYLWIIGHFYSNNTHSFLYLLGVYGAMMVALVIVMTVVTRGRPVRTPDNEETNSEKDEMKSDTDRTRC